MLPRRWADAGLDHPQAVDTMLRTAGLVPRRIWAQRLHRQWDPASFWALATGSGASRQRLGLIDPDARSVLLAGLRVRLSGLASEDYLWQSEVIRAVASKPGHPGGEPETATRQIPGSWGQHRVEAAGSLPHSLAELSNPGR